jgi:DNA-binding transcriptional regulator YiaG
MAKLEEVFRSEVDRLTKKQLRKSHVPVARDVRGLKRMVKALARAVAGLTKTVGELKARTAAAAPALQAAEEEVKAARMSPRLITKLRTRLGLTQTELAALLGVSGSAVTFWEKGRSRPTGQNFAGLVALRKLGRREVRKLLAEKAPKRSTKPKARKPRRAKKA